MSVSPPPEVLGPYRALAKLALDPADDASWAEPLARLLAAAAAGHGHLPVDECLGGLNPAERPRELIAIESGRALLPRTAAAWREIRAAVEEAHAAPTRAGDDDALRAALDRILPPQQLHDDGGVLLFDNAHQRLAVAALVDARVGVLTGGPGTGKTTTAAALLALRASLDPGLTPDQVLVCAPTGKAANRLRLALAGAAERLSLDPRERELLLALRPRTIHRALEWTPLPPEDGGPFRRDREHPLRARLVLLDEASMADVELTAALVRALPHGASLLLLGDRDQLESVEAGGVLGELVQRGSAGELDPARCARLVARLDPDAPARWRAALPTADAALDHPALPGLAVGLGWSYRARSAPWVLALAELVRPGGSGDAAAVESRFAAEDDDALRRFPNDDALLAACAEAWRALAAAAAEWRGDAPPDDAALQAALDGFQLLVATNAQVDAANRAGLRVVAADPVRRDGAALPHGCPLAIEANDRALDLANGELGIALGTGPGSAATVACFPGLAAPIPLARLPRHRPAFALTIHKSQGSEWRRVAIDLPAHAEALLDRHLLYTAITRSSGWIGLHAEAGALEAALGS